MMSTTKKFILIGLIIFLGRFDIYSVNYNYYQEKNFENIENYDEFEFKRAGSWKLQSAGTPVVSEWNRTWGGTRSDAGHGVVVDSLNNIYITQN